MKYQRSNKRILILFGLLFSFLLWYFYYINTDEDFNSLVEPAISMQQQNQIVIQKNNNMNDNNSNNSHTFTSPISLSYNWPQFKSWKQDNWYFPKQGYDSIDYLHGLQTYIEKGHSYEELILKSKSIINKSPILEDLTIVIYLDGEINQLTSYFDLITRQSASPKYIWILYTSFTKVSLKTLNAYIKTIPIDSKIIDITMYKNQNNQWLTVLQTIPTSYLWLLDFKLDHQMKLISNNELEYLYNINQLKEYQHALIGIDGVLLPSNLNKDSTMPPQFVCLPSNDLPKLSQPVDLFHHAWLLKKDWIQFITSIHLHPTMFQLPLGYHISQSLLRYGNIVSIYLPPSPFTSSSHQNDIVSRYNYRLSCNAIRQQYNNNKAWIQHRSLHISPTALDFRQITIGRQRDDISSSSSFITSWSRNVFYIIHGIDQAKSLYPLLCQKQQYSIHVIVTGVQHGVSSSVLTSILNSMDNNNNNNNNYDEDNNNNNGCPGKNMILIHDLDLPKYYHHSSNDDLLATQLMDDILRLNHVLRPDALIHLFDPQSTFYHSLQLIDSIEKNKDLSMNGVDDCVFIRLPANEIIHLLWISDLPLKALKYWNKISIQLVTITDRRPHSFSRLLQTCSNSYFGGDKVDLVINMEQSSDKVTRSLVNDYQWNHGKKTIRHRIQKGGLMPAIIESWYPKHNDDYGILLEDDISLSPLFYVWSKYNILKYRYGHQGELNKNVYGISLYSPKNIELHRVGRRPFDPNEVLFNTSYPARTPYLSQIPCSWGAVYFPEHWREFHTFLTTQLDDLNHFQFLNISLPMSRSDRWKKSWKKYFIQLVYVRAYMMIYPNFQDFESFSTNHLETGTHVKSEKRIKIIQTFQVPLMQRDTLLSQLPQQHLPELNQLPVLDLWGKLVSFDLIDRRAENWHRRISACKRKTPDESFFTPNDLLCPFTLIPIWDRPGSNYKSTKKVKPLIVTDVVEPIHYQTVTIQSSQQQPITHESNEMKDDNDDDLNIESLDNNHLPWPLSIDVALLNPSIDDILLEMDDEEKDLRQNWSSLKRILQK